MLISFEGVDGCGKSTQIELLQQHLEQKHSKKVHIYREPGGVPLAEELRSLLLDIRHTIDPVSELLMFSSARSQLVQQRIKPDLSQGTFVILDRYFDSTTAYQGYGRGVLPLEDINRLNTWASHGKIPDITFYLKLPWETAKHRMKDRDQDRMERSGEDFFERVISGYNELAQKEQRICTIDATASIGEVFEIVRSRVEELI